jgi:hypothetical protein
MFLANVKQQRREPATPEGGFGTEHDGWLQAAGYFGSYFMPWKVHVRISDSGNDRKFVPFTSFTF